ncbi:MAG: ATP-binding protein [Desulfobacterales bacterium]|nr:ATP-binding protein [Desulfobacterales bacterium]
MFYNRENELALLEREHARKRASFTVIYGRRRVGKTSLLNHFMRNKSAIYYYATETTARQQIESFSRQIGEYFNKEYLRHTSFSGLEDLLAFTADHLPEKAPKLILAIDEYPVLSTAVPGCSSIWQKIWDLHLSRKNIHLILCGSSMSMMHSEILDYTAPLYGRRTANIHLQPMRFRDISYFFPHMSAMEQMNVYAALGTVPKYLEMYDAETDFWKNIRDNVLHKDAYLYHEARFLLKDELAEPATFFSILQAVAGGHTRIGDLGSRLGVSPSHLSRYMKKLCELDIIAREVPVTEKNPLKSKLGRYRFRDRYLRFWFEYVFRNSSLLETGHMDTVLQEIKKSFTERFVAHAFEDYVLERIQEAPERFLGFVPTKIGRWWTNKQEIDLVAIGDKKVACIECKWREQPVGYDVYADLKAKSADVGYAAEPLYVLFSKNGFRQSLQEADDARCFTFEETLP